jgi:hypothetical protein
MEKIAQGDLVEEAQDLHDDDAGRQDRRAMQIVLPFLLSHTPPPKITVQYYTRKMLQNQGKPLFCRGAAGGAPEKDLVLLVAAAAFFW